MINNSHYVSYLYRDLQSSEMDTKHKTLSSQSAEVIRHFTSLSQSGFTLAEVTTFLNHSSGDAVRKLMRDMVNRGLLLRLKDGVYWMIPYEQDASNYFPDWRLVAGHLVGKANYYIGYYSALELHGLITQPSMVGQIVVNRQIKPAILKIRERQYQFIYHNKTHFLAQKISGLTIIIKFLAASWKKHLSIASISPTMAAELQKYTKPFTK